VFLSARRRFGGDAGLFHFQGRVRACGRRLGIAPAAPGGPRWRARRVEHPTDGTLRHSDKAGLFFGINAAESADLSECTLKVL
jgi:hypothetical protein